LPNKYHVSVQLRLLRLPKIFTKNALKLIICAVSSRVVAFRIVYTVIYYARAVHVTRNLFWRRAGVGWRIIVAPLSRKLICIILRITILGRAPPLIITRSARCKLLLLFPYRNGARLFIRARLSMYICLMIVVTVVVYALRHRSEINCVPCKRVNSIFFRTKAERITL